ncbi:porin family protein [Pseudoalteromonas xiamenensis]|uniref:Porin family protein n=1 Tax=Pseudoalteromonas xiamenensis TaxID=882626 RepID=A0A975DGE7_9GAMM|nr:porin family protein [Pseudoalteromonas xiamenensis]QTH71386.1 porin family protein [Pseudoalteromonas xiamenensis]
MKKSLTKLLLISVATFSLSATAAINKKPIEQFDVYAGIGYGQYSLQWEDRERDMEFDDDSSMLKAYVGTYLTPYWSVELGYENFDEASDIDNYAEFDGFTLGTRFIAPITDYVSLYAKGGWFEWDGEFYADVPALGRISSNSRGGDWFYGAGIGFDLSSNLGVRLEYLRYELEENIEPDLDVASISLEYTF